MDTENNMLDEGESSIIERPPKLYIDTNHLINIANLRYGRKLPPGQSKEAYTFVDNCIKQHYGIIFNPSAPLEWVEGKATEESAKEIAAVIDSAKLKYQFEQDSFIYAKELLYECHRQDPSIKIPKLPVMHLLSDGGSYEPAYGLLAHQVPDYFREGELPHGVKDAKSVPKQVLVASVREHVKEAFLWKERNPELYRERVEGFKDALSDDIERANEYFKSPKRHRIEWMKRFLKIDKILAAFNPGLDIDNIFVRIAIEECPGVRLYFLAREKRIKAGYAPKDNEVDDWLFLPVVPYADLVLIDSNLREFILQADRSLESKVVCNMTDAVDILKTQTLTW